LKKKVDSFSIFDFRGELSVYSPLKFNTTFSTSPGNSFVFEVYKSFNSEPFEFIKKVNVTVNDDICLQYDVRFNETLKKNVTISDSLDICGQERKNNGKLFITLREESDPILFKQFASKVAGLESEFFKPIRMG
jgi:hypothetical protein